MKKQPEITDQTRSNIVTAFCQLYTKHPIEQIRVKDVIASAGYNRSTFYEYFSDIYAVLTYIEDDVIAYIREGFHSGDHIPAELLRLLDAKEEYLKALLGPFGCVHFQDRLKREFLPQATHSGNDQVLQAYLSEFHISVSLSMYRLWLNRGKDISLGELSKLIHTLYTTGVQGILNC